ncbi:hypothetical protein BU24DRAFT_422954 [Aaosphaeria arxii CBS 175.79]|uniref:Nucleoporin Nup54 alpha-helical domain-containing protein n=1 Tax=Aaosphaeria arxii CBS 175.79 TaxID=1450172 RepID=A0A6A5XVC2_9PLEO|nr:uncharacterized protein BU24DRAFT_422954 [Aaosphaeria arxii CBS 175.79]KAF2016580.1 hypothetical protein BU24DRAFT_422954 [Aaosphaeria arxii CBS 175.79]
MSFGGLGTGFGGAEKKTGTLFGSTTAPAGGLFSQTQQPTGGSLFGATTTTQQQPQQQQQNAGSSLFGNTQQNAGSSLFANTQQQPQQPQQPQLNNSLFGGKLQPAPTLPALQAQQLAQSQQGLPQLRQNADSGLASSLLSGQREKSVTQQMQVIADKWNPKSFNCAFQHYFYNEVDPDQVPYYGPQPHEDEKKWEEALANKPGPGSIPILISGFDEMAARIQYQNLAVTALRTRLHQINENLIALRNTHEFKISIRLQEAKRKHVVHTQRTLALATKVQILRNRGYVMDQAEEELKKKLAELERKTFDPVLSGRQEEIWARMSGVRERARILQEETEKLAKTVDSQQGEVLSEEDQKQIEKLLKDYDKQLDHLKKWVDDTKEEYEVWEKDRKPSKSAGR